MQDPNRKLPSNTQDSPCLFAKCLYRATSKQELFQLYTDELMRVYKDTQDTNALLEAGFVKYYASQIQNKQFIRSSKQVHGQLQKLVAELDSKLESSVEGRCKAVVSTVNKAKKYIDHLGDVIDIYAFRVMLFGPFSEQELVSFCYKFLDKAAKFYTSNGYILCQSSPVSNTLSPDSEDWNKIVHPTEEDLRLVSWIGPKRKKDYISNAKENLYQSLHAAFVSPDGFLFELQIRTWNMHIMAEEGDSEKGSDDTLAHGNYKMYKYPDGITFDPLQVKKIPGFIALVNPETGKLVIHDTIGLMEPQKIISGI